MTLGIVFLFALAVNRGWIGPTARVLLGGLASAAAFAAGVEIARRYGRLYAAYGAVGAGLAGGYATVLAAAGLYDLLPEAAGLVLAAAIAGGGVAVALRWSSELVAGLGLIGAATVPVLLLGDTDGPTVLGTSFTAIVLAGIAILGVARGWKILLGIGTTLAVAETLGLFVWEEELTTSLLILGTAVWAVLVSTGIAWQIVRDREPVGGLTASYVFGSGAFAWWAVAALFTDEPKPTVASPSSRRQRSTPYSHCASGAGATSACCSRSSLWRWVRSVSRTSCPVEVSPTCSPQKRPRSRLPPRAPRAAPPACRARLPRAGRRARARRRGTAGSSLRSVYRSGRGCAEPARRRGCGSRRRAADAGSTTSRAAWASSQGCGTCSRCSARRRRRSRCSAALRCSCSTPPRS